MKKQPTTPDTRPTIKVDPPAPAPGIPTATPPTPNTGTEVLYADGIDPRYWITRKTQREELKRDGSHRRWVDVYHITGNRGHQTTTDAPERLIPLPHKTDPETPSAVKFARHVQTYRYPTLAPGDQVLHPEHDSGTENNQDTWTVTGIREWQDDDEPAYGFWLVNVTNNRTGATDQTIEDILAPDQP